MHVNNETTLETYYTSGMLVVSTPRKEISVSADIDQMLRVSVSATARSTNWDRGARMTDDHTPRFMQSEIVIHEDLLECFAVSRYGTLPEYVEGFKVALIPGEAEFLRRGIPLLVKASEIAGDLVTTSAKTCGREFMPHELHDLIAVTVNYVTKEMTFNEACNNTLDWQANWLGIEKPEFVRAIKEAFAALQLDIPTGEDLLANLLRGDRVEIEGHRLSYDPDNDCVWVTNPYGVDAALFAPTSERCQVFVDAIRSGKEYGPIPN